MSLFSFLPQQCIFMCCRLGGLQKSSLPSFVWSIAARILSLTSDSLLGFFFSRRELKQIILLFPALALNWKKPCLFCLLIFFFYFPGTSETRNIVTLGLDKPKLSYYSHFLPVPPLAAAPSLSQISLFRNLACGGCCHSPKSTQWNLRVFCVCVLRPLLGTFVSISNNSH